MRRGGNRGLILLLKQFKELIFIDENYNKM